jgi:UDP-N-acetylglucosamine:LPS N-acetylglucosamine transferase
MFVGSKQIYKLARERGIPDDKLVRVGLPIRHDFAIQSSKLGDRFSPEGKEYQRQVRAELNLPAVDKKTLLVMGGGEGVGSLSNIVNALYVELVKQGIDAIIMVVCGRNAELKSSLETRDWNAVFQKRSMGRAGRPSRRGLFSSSLSALPDIAGCGTVDITDSALTAGCIEAGGTFRSLRKILSSGSIRAGTSAMFIPSPATVQSTGISDSANNLPCTPILEDEKKDDKTSTVATSADDDEAENKKPVKALREAENVMTSLKTIPSGEVVLADSDDEENSSNDDDTNAEARQSDSIDANGVVDVVPLGFVTKMAEYMVACDVLISKAGPGTISEAAALSLPVMLTSFLPGQEEGNVDYVTDGGFGAFCQDTDPQAIAEEVALWLHDDEKLAKMASAAKKMGYPNAARDIVKQIGDSTLKWRELNDGKLGIPTDEEEQVLTDRTVAEIEAAERETQLSVAKSSIRGDEEVTDDKQHASPGVEATV